MSHDEEATELERLGHEVFGKPGTHFIWVERDPSRVNTDVVKLREVGDRADASIPASKQFDLAAGERQRLFQNLWDSGLRPSDWEQVASPLRLATESAMAKRIEVLQELHEALLEHMLVLVRQATPIVIVNE